MSVEVLCKRGGVYTIGFQTLVIGFTLGSSIFKNLFLLHLMLSSLQNN